MGLRQTYRRSSHNRRGRKRGGGGKQRRFMIPPTIREEEEEECWDSEGNPIVHCVNHGGGRGGEGERSGGSDCNAGGGGASYGGDSGQPTHSDRTQAGTGADSATVCHQVVDLSILDEATPKRGYRKNKKIHHIEWDDTDDSASDASAKTHDSLLVHKCGQKKAVPPRDGLAGHKGRAGRRDKHGEARKGHGGRVHHAYGKFSKVQFAQRIIERIGSGSSFNSSEGPSDSSKHNMKVWENTFRGQGKNKVGPKRSIGIALKKFFSFQGRAGGRSKQGCALAREQVTRESKRMLERKVMDIRKLSL